MSRIRSRLFNQDQIAWLRENYNTMLVVDLVSKMNDRYKTNFTDKQVYRFCWTNWGNSVFSGKPNKGWFTKGHEPWHKGTRGTGVHKGTTRTRRTAQEYFDSFTAKDGETRVDVNGTTWLKVDGEWVIKHRHLYAEHHGVELDHGDIILFKDGDNRNFTIDNLIRVDRRVHSAMISGDLKQYDGELIGAAILTAKLRLSINDKEKSK